MEEKEILEKANALLEQKIVAKSINNVNHVLGHPYTIGPGHIGYASDHHSGMLGLAAIEGYEKKRGRGGCAAKGCQAYYHEHISDRVLLLQLTQNLTQDEARSLMIPLRDVLTQNKIDGVCFVETPEQFRIK